MAGNLTDALPGQPPAGKQPSNAVTKRPEYCASQLRVHGTGWPLASPGETTRTRPGIAGDTQRRQA
jgi:hypothetical protein